jgi:hypothetical protein
VILFKPTISFVSKNSSRSLRNNEKRKGDRFSPCLKMIKPILLYGCEVWGFGKNEVLERVHLKFCKILLNLKSSTPNYMVYGVTSKLHVFVKITPK